MRTKSDRILKVFYVIFLLLADSNSARAADQESGHDFSTVKSPRTETVLKLAKEMSAPTSILGKLQEDDRFQLQCLETEGNATYIGVKQLLDIHASLSAVDAVIMAINEYHDLFPGYKETKISDRAGTKLLTYWEQIVPVPFVPNIKYEVVYELEQPSPEQRLYRYHLHKPTQLKASDGFILIRQVNEHLTHYLEYDFFDADWGMAKIAGKSAIWDDSVEGLIHSDLAVKMKAENPTWTADKARKEAKKLVDSKSVSSCYQQRIKLK